MINNNNDKRGITYHLVCAVRVGLDSSKLIAPVEGNGKLLACRTEHAVVNNIVTLKRARHCDVLSR